MKTVMPALFVFLALLVGGGAFFFSATGLFGGGGPSSFWDTAGNILFLGVLGLALGYIIKSLTS